jgi:hypothetical protein
MMIILAILGLSATVALLIRITIYALPAYVAVASGLWAYSAGVEPYGQ